MIISQSEFKGKPLIVFRRTEDDKFPISFGIRKVQVILENIEALKAFYAQHRTSND
jgi:hypothetical protein